MMKLVGSNQWRGYAISRVFRSAFYSSQSQSSSSPQKDSLSKRISGFAHQKSSVIPVIDKWIEEGRQVKQSELYRIVKQLRSYRRYSHALQIQEHSKEKLNFEVTPGGIAIQLDLISKVHGIDEAEEYFNSIPESLRLDEVHGALLNCYAEKRCVEKADELFRKMKELGFVKSVLTYNVMLSLCSRMEAYEKLNNLIQEMEEKGIEGDSYTFCIRLNAYATSNVEEMENLLTKMEADCSRAIDFHTYFAAAKGYLRAGLTEKALPVIKKAEKMIKGVGNKSFYEHLLTLYAATGNKDEVHRIWNLYKVGRVFNNGYLSMISSLVKFDDVDGVEKIFGEWVSGTSGYDSRIVSSVISLYCKKRLSDKAFSCAEQLTRKGHKLNPGIWQHLTKLCCVEGQMERAVETMKNAINLSEGKWGLNHGSLADCFEYLKKKGDVETSHEILKLLREKRNLSDDVCDRLAIFLNSDEESGALAAIENSDLEKKADLVVDEKSSLAAN